MTAPRDSLSRRRTPTPARDHRANSWPIRSLSDRLGKSARSQVTGRFTWQATAERCLAAYG